MSWLRFAVERLDDVEYEGADSVRYESNDDGCDQEFQGERPSRNAPLGAVFVDPAAEYVGLEAALTQDVSAR